MATIKDVAKAAGVSIATVSATVNGKGGVSEKRSRRVWEAVEAVGYSPHGIARSLRLGRTQVIGLIVGDIANPFFTSLAKAVEARASAAGYSVIVANSDEEPKKELALLKMLREQRVAGILLAPCGHDEPYRQALLRFADMPLVVVDRQLANMPFGAVVVDNVAAARVVTDYLVRLGHRRIAMLGGQSHLSTSEERQRGFREGLAAAGIGFDEALEPVADSRMETAYESVQRLLTLRKPPTAIIAGNNLMTLGAIQAVTDMGFRCPEQVSIAGIDDFSWSAVIRPKLTTVAQPIDQLGGSAVDELFARMSEPGRVTAPARVVTLAPRFVIRESCGRAPKK